MIMDDTTFRPHRCIYAAKEVQCHNEKPPISTLKMLIANTSLQVTSFTSLFRNIAQLAKFGP